MSRPFRGTFNILTFLSLVAFVAIVAIWMTSYRAPYEKLLNLGHAANVQRCDVILYRGRVSISNWPQVRADMAIQHDYLQRRMAILMRKHALLMQPRTDGFEEQWAKLSADFERLREPPGSANYWSHGSRLPFPICALMTAILPLLFVKRLSAVRRRAQFGLCHRCGYDLIPSPKPVIAILPGEQQQQQQPTPRP